MYSFELVIPSPGPTTLLPTPSPENPASSASSAIISSMSMSSTSSGWRLCVEEEGKSSVMAIAANGGRVEIANIFEM